MNKGPLYSHVDFYTKIRPRLKDFLKSDITQITSLKDITDRLKPPLSLRIYLRALKSMDEFEKDHP